MGFNKKDFFDSLDADTIKAAKKNDKKFKDKKEKNKSFFDQDIFDKKDSKKKKKKKDDKTKSKDKKKKSKEKDSSKKKDYSSDKPQGIGEGKLAKKIMKEINSKELRDAFKRDKVLIDNKKFWTSD